MALSRRSFKSDGPAQISAVTAWLRNTTTTGTATSVVDMLNANPATGTGAQAPACAASANSHPIITFDGSNDFLSWPFIAATAPTPTWGIALWIRPTSVTGVRTILSAERSHASVDRLALLMSGDDLLLDVYTSNGVSRRGLKADILVINTWQFITAEFDGGQSTEALKCMLTHNLTAQSLTFSNSSGVPPGSAMPATLVVPTGAQLLGLEDTTNLRPFVGSMGTNIFSLGGAGGISGGGLLTATQRLFLHDLESPT